MVLCFSCMIFIQGRDTDTISTHQQGMPFTFGSNKLLDWLRQGYVAHVTFRHIMSKKPNQSAQHFKYSNVIPNVKLFYILHITAESQILGQPSLY